MKMYDSLIMDAPGLTITKDGYAVGEGRIARAGNVQMYRGHELGLTGDKAAQTYGVYRDPAVVFDEDSMMSLAGRPITRGHPPEGVSATSWKDLAVGSVGGVIRRDGEHVVAPMAIMDATAAKEVADGARALSAGYTCEIIPDEGVTEDGTAYQFRQAGKLRFNHVAYLPDNNPRAGNTRIGDADSRLWGVRPVTLTKDTEPMHKIVFDGLTVEVNDQAREIITKLQGQLADAETDLAKKDAEITAKDKDLATKDADLTAKDKELADAKKAVPVGAALDSLVAERQALVDSAKAVNAELKLDGLSNADIKKSVVRDAMGADVIDGKLAGKSEAYVDAFYDANFDHLADSVKSERGLVDNLTTLKRTVTNDSATLADEAYNASIARFDRSKKA